MSNPTVTITDLVIKVIDDGATVDQRPDALSLSLNLKPLKLTCSSVGTLPIKLKKGDAVLLDQSYQTDADGKIEVDLRRVVHDSLSVRVTDTTAVYEQTNLAAQFTIEIEGVPTIVFTAVRGGVDQMAETATAYLTGNWLTWQPNTRPVTYYTPEYLTYYATQDCVCRLTGYFANAEGEVTTTKTVQVFSLASGKAYTIPAAYNIVSGWLGMEYPAYYDMWIEDADGNRLSYVQRYYADTAKSRTEDWIVFENSLGGIDTLRAYGALLLAAEHTHNLAEMADTATEYRVDAERVYEKHTGYLDNEREAKWALDFFISPQKYIYTGSILRRIVVTESSVSGKLKTEPVSYSFKFKFADSQPLLNLSRLADPETMRHVTVPDTPSFTLPPRLAELYRLPLTEGALFLVQNPYSEEWGITSLPAIISYVKQNGNWDEDYPLRLDIDTDSMYRDMVMGEQMTLTCRLMRGWSDLTAQVAAWEVTRDSGSPQDDAAWLNRPKVQNFTGDIVIQADPDPTVDDLGQDYTTTFTFKATLADSSVINNSITI